MIPDSPADITAAWLSEALGTTVTEVSATNLGEGVGVMAEVTRLTVTYADEGAGPATLIAKTASPAEANRETATTFGFYTREVAFYREVAHRMKLRVPTCHFVDADPSGVPFVLLLDVH